MSRTNWALLVCGEIIFLILAVTISKVMLTQAMPIPEPAPEKAKEIEGGGFAPDVTYLKDNRTGLCFANAGMGNSWVLVPCSPAIDAVMGKKE